MSCYEWEEGTLILPTAEVAPLKKVLREYTNQLHADVLDEAKKMHRSVKTTSLKKYCETLNLWVRGVHESGAARSGQGPAANRLARWALEGVVQSQAREGKGPRTPTVADVERVAPRATNRTTNFTVCDQHGFNAATITFEGRKVTWHVDENNHAVETAHEAPLGALFLAHLDKIRWTAKTGGTFTGNNEYNREDRDAGGGSNYITLDFGPLGEDAKARSMGIAPSKWRAMKRANAAQRSRFTGPPLRIASGIMW